MSAWKASRESAADSHIKSNLITAGMLLIRPATLEADISCCLNLLLEETQYSSVWLNYLHIPPNGSLVWSAPPWHWAGNMTHILAIGLIPDVVWENAPSAQGMLASPAFKVRLRANTPPPIPGPAPARGKPPPPATSKPKDQDKLYSKPWQNLQA